MSKEFTAYGGDKLIDLENQNTVAAFEDAIGGGGGGGSFNYGWIYPGTSEDTYTFPYGMLIEPDLDHYMGTNTIEEIIEYIFSKDIIFIAYDDPKNRVSGYQIADIAYYDSPLYLKIDCLSVLEADPAIFTINDTEMSWESREEESLVLPFLPSDKTSDTRYDKDFSDFDCTYQQFQNSAGKGKIIITVARYEDGRDVLAYIPTNIYFASDTVFFYALNATTSTATPIVFAISL